MLNSETIKIKFIKKHLPSIIFCFILIIAVILTSYHVNMLGRISKARAIKVATDLVNDKLDNNIYGFSMELYAARAYFNSSADFNRVNFYNYFQNTNAKKFLTGVSSLTYVERVKAEDKQAFVNKVKTDTSYNKNGYPSFSIHPDKNNSEYWVATYSGPEETFGDLMGYDLASEPERQRAISEAIDSGEPHITNLIKLEPDDQWGFIYNIPLYKRGTVNDTIAQRRENFIGAINFGIRSDQFFPDSFTEALKEQKISTIIYDKELNDAVNEKELIYSFDAGEEWVPWTIKRLYPAINEELTFSVGNRPWDMIIYAKPGYGLTNFEKVFPIIFFAFWIILASAIAAHLHYYSYRKKMLTALKHLSIDKEKTYK